MAYVQRIIDDLKLSSPAQPEFYQAVTEVLHSLRPLLDKEPKYLKNKILERLVEPDRQMFFRITWVDDNGESQVNKAYRV